MNRRYAGYYKDLLQDVIDKYEDELISLDPSFDDHSDFGNARFLYEGDLSSAYSMANGRRAKEVILVMMNELGMSKPRFASNRVHELERRVAQLESGRGSKYQFIDIKPPKVNVSSKDAFFYDVLVNMRAKGQLLGEPGAFYLKDSVGFLEKMYRGNLRALANDFTAYLTRFVEQDEVSSGWDAHDGLTDDRMLNFYGGDLARVQRGVMVKRETNPRTGMTGLKVYLR